MTGRIVTTDYSGEEVDVTYGDTRYGMCSCSCQGRTNYRSDGTRSRFLPGHDAKLKSRLLRLARAGDEQAIEELRRRGWEHFLHTNRSGRRSSGSRGRRFGVELEVVGITQARAAQALTEAGVHCTSESYNHRTRPHWKVVPDATVQGGCEVVSPPLRGQAGFDELERVMAALRDAGARINRTCGTHVHHEMKGLTGPQLARVLEFWVARQQVFDQLVAPSRRNTRWSAHWGAGEATRVANVLRGSSGRRGIRLYADRYRNLNVMSYPKYGTFEVRLHQGTLNFTKLSRWIRLFQSVIETVKANENANEEIGRDLPGMLTGLDTDQDVRTYFVQRAQGFGFLQSFDAEDLEAVA